MNNSVSFQGVYKMTAPRVDQVKDPKEKEALTECVTNSVVIGCGASVAKPRVNEKEGAMYFKIDNKNDKIFEEGFQSILQECNKKFNTDLANKVYMTKVDDAEFNKATEIS